MNGQRFTVVMLGVALLYTVLQTGVNIALLWRPLIDPTVDGPRAVEAITGHTIPVSNAWQVILIVAGGALLVGLVAGAFLASLDQAVLLAWRALRAGRHGEQQETE